jgi:hypothetical protein
MRCGSRGCECTTCFDCGRSHESCTCDLKARTQAYLTRSVSYDENEEARELLREWMES